MYRSHLTRIVHSMLAALVALTATAAFGQSSRETDTDSWGSVDENRAPTRSTRRSGRTQLFGDDIRGYDEFVGFYGQFGVSVGEIEFDGGTDVDTGGGFTMTGGYRFLPWLSGEANFSYLGGGEVENTNREADFFAFTFGPKVYPLALLGEDQPIPEYLQPYATIGIGGGEYDVERTSFEESTFIARFIFGFDVWLTDNFGTFVEGGYHVAADDDIDGTGLFTVGGQYRF